ncbi:MAG: cytochrome c biogenesis CcdA family protein [Chloroflexota bacterium]
MELTAAPSSGRWRSVWLSGIAVVAVLSASVVAGFMIGGTGGATTAGVLGLSAQSTNALGSLGDLLPLGFAFAAGMVATVNPCGFVMLPAYLGLYVGTNDGTEDVGPRARVLKALAVSAAVGLGFVILFGVTGTVLASGIRSIVAWFPWIGLGVGVFMGVVGGYVLAGGKLYSNFATTAADRIGDPRDSTMRGYFLFGISYGIASLSCTLPIFLALVTSSLATGGILFAAGQFLVYALGMTFVITVLTVGIALFRGAFASGMRKLMPYVQPASAVLLLLAGGYIVFYWLTEGGLADRIAG